MAEASILLIEDDDEIGRLLTASLGAAGFRCTWRKTLLDARNAIQASFPQLVILDLTLPDGDGMDFILALRSQSDIPLIVLSARHAEQEKIECFNRGADDYIAKPFGMGELLARVRVALKRAAMMHMRDHQYAVDGLIIDSQQGTVSLYGAHLHLTPIEYKLLFMLARNPGKVFTHAQLLSEVWGSEYRDETHYLRIHMGRLRARIEKVPAEPRFILTELGVGYRLAPA